MYLAIGFLCHYYMHTGKKKGSLDLRKAVVSFKCFWVPESNNEFFYINNKLVKIQKKRPKLFLKALGNKDIMVSLSKVQSQQGQRNPSYVC